MFIVSLKFFTHVCFSKAQSFDDFIGDMEVAI